MARADRAAPPVRRLSTLCWSELSLLITKRRHCAVTVSCNASLTLSVQRRLSCKRVCVFRPIESSGVYGRSARGAWVRSSS